MLELINQIVTPQIISVILTLLLIFQWYKQYAKEQSVKHNLFSIRRILGRVLETPDTQTMKEKTYDLTDILDATLATLGARMPFVKRVQETIGGIESRFRKESIEELKRLPNEDKINV